MLLIYFNRSVVMACVSKSSRLVCNNVRCSSSVYQNLAAWVHLSLQGTRSWIWVQQEPWLADCKSSWRLELFGFIFILILIFIWRTLRIPAFFFNYDLLSRSCIVLVIVVCVFISRLLLRLVGAEFWIDHSVELIVDSHSCSSTYVLNISAASLDVIVVLIRQSLLPIECVELVLVWLEWVANLRLSCWPICLHNLLILFIHFLCIFRQQWTTENILAIISLLLFACKFLK